MTCGMLVISSNGSGRLRENVFWLNLGPCNYLLSLSLSLSLSLPTVLLSPPPPPPPPPPPHAFISFSACLVFVSVSPSLSLSLCRTCLSEFSFHPLSLPPPHPHTHTHTPTCRIAPSTSYTSLCIMCLSVRLPLSIRLFLHLCQSVCLPLNRLISVRSPPLGFCV